MNETQLVALFRHALRVSLAVPLASGVACSDGTSQGTELTSPDTGTREVEAGAHDTGTHDASTLDALRHDTGMSEAEAATGDASTVDPCHPVVPECEGPFEIPLSCYPTLPTGEGGTFSITECTTLCPAPTGISSSCYVDHGEAGASALVCSQLCGGGGRAFEGMKIPARRRRLSPLGRYFSESAYLEAASIEAFRILGEELVAHGAPQALIVEARRAADDEVRHARMTRTLARRYGAAPTRPRAGRRHVRPLLAVAIENAVEGCVRETFAALVVRHQAESAADARVRAAMASIAPDEARHATLAWSVAAWAESRLDAKDRARVQEARREAVRELREATKREVPESLVKTIGVPDRKLASRMVSALDQALWSPPS